jgi:hypothetical protein
MSSLLSPESCHDRRESFAGSIPAASVAHARSGQTLKSLIRRFESARRLSLGGL